VIALFLYVGHLCNLLRCLAQTHAQIVCPIIETRHAYSDLFRGALDLNGELLTSRRIPDKVSEFSRARPPYELAFCLFITGCVLTEARIGLDTALSQTASKLSGLLWRFAVLDTAAQLACPLRLAIDSNLIDLFEVFVAVLVRHYFTVITDSGLGHF
jgi:hypothetical protein